ncbi:MAG: O-antigen ligase family protein [Pedosphaera sp.]|nr:O-antigen ligase family protein [Pedosphaera sp.]
MQLKEYLALALLLFAIPICTAVMVYWRRARDLGLFVLVFGAMVTYDLDVNFVSREWYRGTTRGFEISFLDIIALALLAAMYLRPRKGEVRFFWPASLAPLLVYFGYCFLSVLFSDPKLFGMFELLKVARGILIFVVAANYVREEKQLRLFLWALICAVVYQGCSAVKMRYLGGVHRVYGTLEHPNSLSLYMCMALPVLYAATMARLPRWLRRCAFGGVALAMVAVILTISRTGILTLGLVLVGIVAACFSFRLNLRNLFITGGVLFALVFGVAYSWKTIVNRFEGATFDDEKEKGRGEYIRLAGMIVEDRFFGVGLGNWSYWVSNEYGPKDGSPFVPYIGTGEAPDQTNPRGLETAQAPPAHNLAALTAGELGWPGLIIFTVVWLRWFHLGFGFLWKRRADPMLRIGAGLFFAVCAAFFQSLTEWEYRQTPILFIFHILLGVLAALHWRKKNPLPEEEPA